MDVSLASQTHQVPHVGLPQIEPVIRLINVNPAPIGAKALAMKKKIGIRDIRPKIEKPAANKYIPSAHQEAGTCTYMMRKISPCW